MTSVSGSGERILAILDLFTESRSEWNPDEMMDTLGYSRTTLYRYLKTLKDAGYIASLPQSGFVLGPRVTELDFLMRRSDPLIKVGGSHLKQLAARFSSSVFLVRWYGRKLLCVASEVSASQPLSSYPRGRPMPLGRGAISRAIVAFLPAHERRALVTDYLDEFLISGQGGTVEDVLAGLRSIRKRGVATAHGEVTPGVVGVAGPILITDSAPIGAICLTITEHDLGPDRLGEIQTAIRQASEEVSTLLGPATPSQAIA